MISRNTPKIVLKVVTSTLYLPMLVGGMVLGVITFARAYETVYMHLYWPAISCQITASEATREYGDYFFKVQYTCALDGKPVIFDTYRKDYAGTDDFAEAQALADRYPVGSTAICYVSPREPYQAVLVRRNLWTLLIPLVPVGFAMVSCLLFYETWWGESDRQAKRVGSRSTEQGSDPKPERPRSLSTPQEIRIRSWLGISLFGGLFLLVGLYMMLHTVVRPARDVLHASGWVETPCQILSSQVRVHSGDGFDETDTYSVDIFYQYTFAGQEYRSNRYSFYDHLRSWMRGYRQKAVAQHPYGSTSVCYVNPKDPRDVVLNRGFTWEALWVLPSSVPTFIGALVLIVCTKAMFDQFRLPTIEWMPKRQSRPPYAELPGTIPGWVMLKPESSAGGCVLVLPLVSLICFGIAIAMLLATIRGWRSSDLGLEGSLCTLPMSLSALLVGGLFAWLYARSVRALRLTPEPRLCVSRDTLPVGASFDLHWTIEGPISQIRRLTIHFVGREETALHSKDSEGNQALAFHRADILDTRTLPDMTEGRARVTVPRGMMHSFDGDNSKIVWLLEVKIDVGKALPVEWQYRILVLPLPAPKEHP